MLSQLERLLPNDFDEQPSVCYIEPFVGGGAMLFHMLQHHPNIKKAVINDINEDLVNAYKVIRDYPEELISLLRDMEGQYLELTSMNARKEYYLACREYYNTAIMKPLDRAAYTIFINHTCFNGLYRVNAKGKFNVPVGKNKTLHILDEEAIRTDSALLKNVEILCGDYHLTLDHVAEDTYVFFYIDPPYRPLNETSNFNDYQQQKWGDEQQLHVKLFCDEISRRGYKVMASNSDSYDGEVNFFEGLYDGYEIGRVLAPRYINAFATKRSSVTELVIRNYDIPREEIFINVPE